MCGIIGYIGKNKNAIDIAIDGLKQLEYRGYDSAGIASLTGDSVFFEKNAGRVKDLEQKIKHNPLSSCAIAHTRWATHGMPSFENAHPHTDCKNRIFLVHNGIIENYFYLKEVLLREGHIFSSETDTEVLAHLVERHLQKHSSLENAVLDALYHVKGTFALAVISLKEPQKIVAVRRSSPLIIGLSSHGHFLSSDASALTRHTKKVVYMDDDEIAVLTPDDFIFTDFKRKEKNKKIDIIDWDSDEAKKEGFPHFMLKEICRQPESITDSLRGRLIDETGEAKLGGLEVLGNKLKNIKKFRIVACGTASYAGMIGKYMFENLAGIPAEVDLASEFRYRNPILEKDEALLAISQSGETADTLAALRLAKKQGNLTLGIVNTVGSAISRETDAGVYNHIGPEIGVASTKAFTSQVAILALFSLFWKPDKKLAYGLRAISSQIRSIIKKSEYIKKIAQKYNSFDNFLYIGRNYNYPAALEGALKLKEISYIHSEGYAAGEMKHGSIALIDKDFPTVAVLGPQKTDTHSKIISNIEEIKARGGPVFAIAEYGDEKIKMLADDVFFVPKTIELLSPILNVIPLQLFAYHMADLRGCDIDKPRNLAKSVTVE